MTVHKIVSASVLSAALLVFASGCATKGPFRTVSYQEFASKRIHSVLSGDEPTEASQRYLRRHDLTEAMKEDPIGVLVDIDRQLCPDVTREELFVLSELCYLEAKKSSQDTEEARSLYLSAARYAYACLFDEKAGPRLNEFDPRFRIIVDLYNYSLAAAFETRRSGWTAEAEKGLPSPLLRGSVTFSASEDSYIQLDEIDRGTAAHRLEVASLQSHFRRSGIGLPVMAKRDVNQLELDEKNPMTMVRLARVFAATGLVRFPGSICDIDVEKEPVKAILESYDPVRTPTVKIGSMDVPLEADLTVPLAFLFEEGTKEIGGGIKGLYRKLQGGFMGEKRGLILLQPFEPGKIPVVFVHGLLSSPLTWIDMINDLMADPALMPHFQFAFFFYPTGNPILYSASEMRAVLEAARQTVDPDGTDPAMDQMVIIGHSMGGLLTRLMISESDGDFMRGWASELSLDDYDLTEMHSALVEKVDHFKPVPGIGRVLFLSTPHKGADLASGVIGRLGDSVTMFPRYMLDEMGTTLANAGIKKKDLPTGIDNLKYGCNFMNTLNSLKMNEDVPYHLIVGNQKAANTPGGSDGVVKYGSSHIEGAVSEKIVKSGHNVHTKPPTILEVRRILLQHLE